MAGDRTPRGYVGATDEGWYSYLHGRGGFDEVNFWRPRDTRRFRTLRPGEPFFFKLKKPWKAIVGFGYFARFVMLPLSLVWKTFEEQNGAATYEEMHERIVSLRRAPLAPGTDPNIGCVLLVEPVFFDEPDWVPQPTDFHKNLLQGKSYDLTAGEGLRVWEECLARARAPATAVRTPEPRYGTPTLIEPRLGQRSFKLALYDAYGSQCVVTTEHSIPVLDAAHIRPYASGGSHELQNGLLLRTDIHRLYDDGYVTITPDHVFRVSPLLRERWHNGKTYYEFDNRKLKLRAKRTESPDPELLEWHRDTVFRAG